ncbi:hypothetical protein MPSEU_000121500 [Mayamaea pseudoterrestris]|nr:hypothetical protein MPSEU_000121500 [Mayamaea pseudoterrestris]
MGKKLQGAALRAKKRAHAALEDLQERQAEVFVSETLQADDLFVIDKQGNSKIAAAAANSVKTSKLKKRRMELSAKDQLQVDRLMKSHSAEQLVDMARKGKQDEERRQRVGRKRVNDNMAPGFDLWDEGNSGGDAKQTGADAKQADMDAAAADLIKPIVGGSTLAGVKPAHETTKARKYDSSKRTVKSAVIAVDVAKAGQSYRPDPVAHKQLLQTAAQLEVNREQTLRNLAQPLAQGMSDETKALLMNDDDDDDSSEYDSDDDGDNEEKDAATVNAALGPIIPRREDKLTRAQRNKQKRLRQEQTSLQLSKRQKKLEKQVGELPVYKKEFKRKELQQQQSSKTKVTAPSRIPGQDVDETAVTRNPGRAPTIPLALAAAPSLRSLQPKGSLVQDRLASLMDRNLTTKPTYKATLQRKKRKKSVKGTRNNEANAGGDVVLLG